MDFEVEIIQKATNKVKDATLVGLFATVIRVRVVADTVTQAFNKVIDSELYKSIPDAKCIGILAVEEAEGVTIE